jgi:RNA polymerase sigma factor (sigma-70 family)
VVDRTVDGDVQQDTNRERDVAAVARDQMVNDHNAIGPSSEAQKPLSSQAATYQIVVGDIPRDPPGFQPRPHLTGQLNRPDRGVSVLTGVRGAGKTQLAAAYARAKAAGGWRLVAWVNAVDSGSLLAGLAEVADAAGLSEGSEMDSADAGRVVRRCLEANGDRCLLVFDDAEDPDALRPFVPARGAAQVLITSTRQSAADLGTCVPVDAFSADDALAFLVGRTDLDDEAGAAAVAAELGHLPLSLALAAPVIKGQRHGYGRYLDHLQTVPAEASQIGDEGQPYPDSGAQAVLLSLAAIQAADKSGICARVMAIMAVLSAAGVRRELLHVAGRAGVLASSGRRVAASLVDQVLDWLSDQSLLTISLNGQTVGMHRTVAQVVHDGLVYRGRLGAVCWVAASVLEAHAIAVAGSQDRGAVRHIPQQVTALLDNTAELAGDAAEELDGILLRLRFISLYHLIELGDSAPQAIAVGEPLTEDLERLLGPDHPDTLNARNSLAATYLSAGRVDDAIPLFEQALDVLQRQLGPDHADTLTSQNNLASAYRDAGRVAEAIQLYELNLAERERLLGVDHPGTLNSLGNLAAAYVAAGRVAEAIPLLEQTLAGRERVLGPDHSDTQTSRRNLAKAYQDAGRVAEATSLLEQTLLARQPVLRPDHPRTRTSHGNLPTANRDDGQAAEAIPPAEETLAAESQASADAAADVVPVSFRRPPIDPAGPVLPTGFRRPPADPAGRPLSDRVAGASAKLPHHSSDGQTQDAPVRDAEHDRDIVAAITAGDLAGTAMAYDRYAAALYGYCHWMLHDSADAAESLQNAFILAAATPTKLSEPSMLRPSLFALARTECRRRIRPRSPTRDGADAASQRADGRPRADEVARPVAPVGRLPDATMQFRAVDPSVDANRKAADETVRFRVISESADETVQFPVVSQLGDVTVQFRVVSKPVDATDGMADVNGYLGQAELRVLIRSVLADMKPREREVIELSFRHDLSDNDLAVVLGVSLGRAHALASSARSRLEKSLGAMRTALVGRQACPVAAELLAGWDGQLTEQTHDLMNWHIEQCLTCANHARGVPRPTVLSGLMPLAPLPPELRERVLNCCFSTSVDALTYRRRVVRRAESKWAAKFSQAIRRVSWDSIRANPGAAVAATAVAVWTVAAVSVVLVTFVGPHAAHAQVAQPSIRISSSSPAAVPKTTSLAPRTTTIAPKTTTAAPTSAAGRPSPTVSQPAYVPPPVQPSPSPSPSHSPKPSKSPSPTPSKTTSPSPSSSPSPTAG